ncbi:MAG: TatD family hydrolase [Kiritimatiellae bacterium]|nr:TatD family hydrolase [Kiritimatiellia bacterium]
MRLFDTHCHFEPDDAGVAAALGRARQAGVEKLMAVGGSPGLNDAAVAAVRQAAGNPDSAPLAVCALGFDRDQAGCADLPPVPSGVEPAAWGEIGLDYHYSPETRAAQLALFAAQLEEARRRDLPVVIHTRDADDDTLGVLREVPSRGVIHCFTGTPPFARRLLDMGFYISISGIVTFRAADNVRESARFVPPDRILIETDSPHLAPVPMRGKPNEPAFIVHTCRFLAGIRGISADLFAEQTFANAEAMLGTETCR